jgi:hypothetical protein
MARVYGFASDVFVIDLEEKLNRLAEMAKSGCYIPCEPHKKCKQVILNRKKAYETWGLTNDGEKNGSANKLALNLKKTKMQVKAASLT